MLAEMGFMGPKHGSKTATTFPTRTTAPSNSQTAPDRPQKPGSADNLSYLALLSHSSVLVASIPIPCPSCMLAAHDVHKTCTKTLCFIAPLYSDIAPKTRWSWIS